jgi:hypothetical protein
MIDNETAVGFSVFENKGVYALLLGSGISRAAQIPTGWEIIEQLTRQVAALQGVEREFDWQAWYKKKFKKDPNYSDLINALAQKPDERRAILHNLIEPTAADIEENRKIPTLAHKAIAKLVRDGFIRVIVTINFDRLLENALREEGVEPTVIKSKDDLSGAVPLTHASCYILKLHGDYLDTRIRNTETELNQYPAAINSILGRIFDEHGLIVCGWSGEWDQALRDALVRSPNRRYQIYWTTRKAPPQISLDLIRAKSARVIKINNADEFFESLYEQVETLKTLAPPNPLNNDLLVGLAKKYLSKPEYRIQLADLISEEAKRLRSDLSDPALGVQGTWSPAEFRLRVAKIEIIATRLLRLFLLLGRWGGEYEFGLAEDIIKELGRRKVLGGLNVWIWLQTYVAVLLFYSFGLGLLRAKRLADLFRWSNIPLERESRPEPETSAGQLFLWNWEGGRNDLWQNIDELQNRKNALSDHLHNIFSAYIGDFGLSLDSYTRLFEQFEMLIGLALLTRESDTQLISVLANSHQFMRVPVGRAAWHYDVRDGILAEMKQKAFSEGLLSAGFANGHPDFLKRIIENLERVLARES